ncbi:MAG: Lysine exporter protein LysE/YggA, partial [uncultured Rubrobacteraceae bacterium]
GGHEPDPFPDGLARRYRGPGTGQHPRAHGGRGAGAGRGARLGGRGEPRARGPLGLRRGWPLGAPGAVGRGLLGGQVRRGGVPRLPRRPRPARPRGLRRWAGGAPNPTPKGLYPGRGLKRPEPQDSRVLPGLPAAVRRSRDGRHGPPIARARAGFRAAHPGDLQRDRPLFGDHRLVAEDPPEARGRPGLAYRMRPDLPRPPPGPPGPPV